MGRFNAATLPQEIVRRMRQEDRRSLGVSTPEEVADRAAVALERDLQRDCENWLRVHEVEFLHLSPRAREKAGWPDLVFAWHGAPCGVELKTADGVVSDDQLRVMGRLQANGWRCVVVRSLPAFIDFLGNQ